MNIRETLEALVYFLREGHQSGNTHAAVHGIANSAATAGPNRIPPRLVYLTEEESRRSQKFLNVPCMSVSDPRRLCAARPGSVVFDTWTVEQLAEKALQRIQFLEARLKDVGAERDLFKREMIKLAQSAASSTTNETGKT